MFPAFQTVPGVQILHEWLPNGTITAADSTVQKSVIL